MKHYEPYPMTLELKPHQKITKGEMMTEIIGGKEVRFKVTDILAINTLENGHYEVSMMVRELPGGTG